MLELSKINHKSWREAQGDEAMKAKQREWEERHYEKKQVLKEEERKDKLLSVVIPFVQNNEEESIKT